MVTDTYRPWEYDAPYAHKQAIIKVDPVSGLSYYMGDRTVMHAPSLSEGKMTNVILDNIRKLIGEGQEKRAELYSQQQKFPVDWAEHTSWYESGYLTSKEPIRLVPK